MKDSLQAKVMNRPQHRGYMSMWQASDDLKPTLFTEGQLAFEQLT
jgi:hypothetical protein